MACDTYAATSSAGIVRGVNLDGKDLERLLEDIVEGKKVEKPAP